MAHCLIVDNKKSFAYKEIKHIKDRIIKCKKENPKVSLKCFDIAKMDFENTFNNDIKEVRLYLEKCLIIK